MLPKDAESSTTTPMGHDALQTAAQKVTRLLSKHPQIARFALLAVVVAVAGVWSSLALSRSRAEARGHALVAAFAIKDAVPEDVQKERAQARAEAKKEAQARKGDDGDDGDRARDDDGDDGDDARDDDGDDGDDYTEDAQDGANDGNMPQFADRGQRDAAARARFVELAQTHPGTLGTLAAMEAASIAAPMTSASAPIDAAPKASASSDAELVAKAAAAVDGQNSLMPLAMLREAQMHEDNEAYDLALQAYERIIAAQIHFLGDEARIHKARLLLLRGDLDGADAALEDVQNNYPDTALAEELRIQMAAVEQARADVGPKGAAQIPPTHASRG